MNHDSRDILQNYFYTYISGQRNMYVKYHDLEEFTDE